MADPPRDIIAEALWTKVLEDFASDRAHEAYLRHCREASCLPDAARRYRDFRNALNEDQTEEREHAEKRLAAVALYAMSQLDARRTPGAPRGKRVVTAVAAFIALASVLGLLMLYAL